MGPEPHGPEAGTHPLIGEIKGPKLGPGVFGCWVGGRGQELVSTHWGPRGHRVSTDPLVGGARSQSLAAGPWGSWVGTGCSWAGLGPRKSWDWCPTGEYIGATMVPGLMSAHSLVGGWERGGCGPGASADGVHSLVVEFGSQG